MQFIPIVIDIRERNSVAFSLARTLTRLKVKIQIDLVALTNLDHAYAVYLCKCKKLGR